MVSLPSRPLTTSEVVGGVRVIDGHRRRQTADARRVSGRGYLDVVIAGAAVDDHCVRLPVAVPFVAARSIATCFTLVPERSLTVIVSAPLNAAIWIFSMPLRSIADRADITEQRRAAAVGRDIDALADVGAVKNERVGTRSALDHVAAVAGIPDERIVAVAEQRVVVAPAAGDRIVAGAADQQIVAVTAQQNVVAATPVDRVVASAAVDDISCIRRPRHSRRGDGRGNERRNDDFVGAGSNKTCHNRFPHNAVVRVVAMRSREK